MKILEQINEILKKGHSLEEIGVKNWAFSREDAINIIAKFEEFQVSILGGDVCELVDGIIQYNYDNWYCNRLPDETDIEFSERSVKKARDYIVNYNIKKSTQIFFTFVLDVEDM